jgi:hypothetical protein
MVNPFFPLSRWYPEAEVIAWCVLQIPPHTQAPFGRDDAGVPEAELDLIQRSALVGQPFISSFSNR